MKSKGKHRDTTVMANRPNKTTRNKKRRSMRTDRCGKTGGQKYHVKGSGKDIKIQNSMYTDETNVEYEMYDYTGNNWSHRNTYKTFKEKLRSHTMKTDSYTWHITHNTESAAV